MPANDTAMQNSDSREVARPNGERRWANVECGEAPRHEDAKARGELVAGEEAAVGPSKTSKGRHRPKDALAFPPGGDEDLEAQRREKYRDRLRAVELILNRLFGELKDQPPELWGQRAYLMMVGVIYERLVLYGADLLTDEVVDLAKVMTAYRRAEQGKPPLSGNPAESEAPLADQVADAARELYGLEAAEPEPT